MALLLDRQGYDVKITNNVVKAVARNCRSGKEVMALFLDRQGDDVKITDEMVKIAAHCGQESVLYLLRGRFAIGISVWIPIAQLYGCIENRERERFSDTVKNKAYILVILITPDLFTNISL